MTWPVPEGTKIVSEDQEGLLVVQVCMILPAKLSSGWSFESALTKLGLRTAAPRRRMKESKAEVVGEGSGGIPPRAHMSLFKFELGMLALLGVALPIVYWRRMRIRHL